MTKEKIDLLTERFFIGNTFIQHLEFAGKECHVEDILPEKTHKHFIKFKSQSENEFYKKASKFLKN